MVAAPVDVLPAGYGWAKGWVCDQHSQEQKGAGEVRWLVAAAAAGLTQAQQRELQVLESLDLVAGQCAEPQVGARELRGGTAVASVARALQGAQGEAGQGQSHRRAPECNAERSGGWIAC